MILRANKSVKLAKDFWSRFDFEKGKIKCNQTHLCEDMLQVEFSNNILLDVGYYNGIFKIYIIKDFNWEETMAQYICKDEKSLEKNMNLALNIIRNITKNCF